MPCWCNRLGRIETAGRPIPQAATRRRVKLLGARKLGSGRAVKQIGKSEEGTAWSGGKGRCS